MAVPLVQLTTIDRNGNVSNTLGARLNRPRWFSSGVPLPDGKVLALNGADKDEVVDPGSGSPIRTPELYDPATNTWTDVAPESRDRTYHNAAILLPDGRVLSGGHTPIPASYGAHHTLVPGVTSNNDKDPSFQIWSPPYLFYGPRPRITHAPKAVAWGSTFTVDVDDPSSIRTIVAMRTPSTQHVIDSGTRTLELSFQRSGPHTLTVTVPPTGVVAPPGTYYLFVNRQNPKGLTPSMARIVFIGDTSDNREAVQPMRDDAPAPSGGSATPVKDDSYQATYLGAARQQLGTRLTGITRTRLAGTPLASGVLMIALALGLSVRTRRWLVRRSRHRS